jgi:hypothetical protein
MTTIRHPPHFSRHILVTPDGTVSAHAYNMRRTSATAYVLAVTALVISRRESPCTCPTVIIPR